MRRKFIAVLAALVLLPTLLFAVPVVVTWEWLLEDPMVTTFRYQLDGEYEDGWTVVDATVTSYTERGLDGTRDYSLYLQQSYDGIHFSESAVSVALAMFPPEEIVPVVEEVVAVEEIAPVEIEPVVEEVVAAEEMVPVVEQVVAVEEIAPVAEEPKEKKVVESRRALMISLGGTVNLGNPSIGSYHRFNLQAELGVAVKNMITFNDKLGLGVDLAVAYAPYLTGGWGTVAQDVFSFDIAGALANFDHGVSVSVAPMLNIDLGKVGLNLGAGGFLTFIPAYANSPLYGAFAKGSMEYKFNDTFRMGISGKYGFVLSETANPQFAEGTVYMGFSF